MQFSSFRLRIKILSQKLGLNCTLTSVDNSFKMEASRFARRSIRHRSHFHPTNPTWKIAASLRALGLMLNAAAASILVLAITVIVTLCDVCRNGRALVALERFSSNSFNAMQLFRNRERQGKTVPHQDVGLQVDLDEAEFTLRQRCCVCLTKPSNVVVLDCGHVCWCSGCAHEIITRVTRETGSHKRIRCSVCNRAYRDSVTILANDNNRCSHRFCEAVADILCYPCGHLAYCDKHDDDYDDMLLALNRPWECPTCLQTVQHRYTIFFS